MKRSRYSESQIIKILKEGESGMPVTDICREHGISRSAYCKWKSKYWSMDIHGFRGRGGLDERGIVRSAFRRFDGDRCDAWAHGPPSKR